MKYSLNLTRQRLFAIVSNNKGVLNAFIAVILVILGFSPYQSSRYSPALVERSLVFHSQ